MVSLSNYCIWCLFLLYLISWSRAQFMRQVFARLLRFESMIWSSIRFDISLQNFERPSDFFSRQIEKKRSEEYLVINLAVERKLWAGAHQMEPPSPIQALGVNPFPSRIIIRTVPRGDFARRRWEEPITTTKWHCYCTSSNSRKFVVDRPNTIIS